MTLQWTADLTTGLVDVDREHEQIHRQIESLIEHAEQPDSVHAARGVVEALRRHVTHHFSEEREYMVAYGYPALLEHCAEHDEIHEYVQAFEHELLAADTEPELMVAATRVLGNWLLTHTTTFDRDFARFLRERG